MNERTEKVYINHTWHLTCVTKFKVEVSIHFFVLLENECVIVITIFNIMYFDKDSMLSFHMEMNKHQWSFKFETKVPVTRTNAGFWLVRAERSLYYLLILLRFCDFVNSDDRIRKIASKYIRLQPVFIQYKIWSQ